MVLPTLQSTTADAGWLQEKPKHGKISLAVTLAFLNKKSLEEHVLLSS
jgi:hypothetical protein